MSIMDEFYPGSKQRRRTHHAEPPAEEAPLSLMQTRTYTVDGTEMEFYSLGQLAAALGRKPGTIRKWEHDKVIPKATFQAPNPRRDPRARRRLYTSAQAQGIWRIAYEEQVIGDSARPVGSTDFTKRVFALFKELREAK